MKTSPRLPVAALVALLLAIGAALVAPAGPASAASIPGMVLSSTPATLPPELAPLATGKRITYVTTDVNGNLITATGLIMTPVSYKKNRVAAWAHGTTGLADQCTPSTNQNVFWPEARTAIAALLGQGFTVAAPDYPGLGTSQQHPYLIGLSEARSIIDAVKAARNLDSSLIPAYVIDGHSQGGQGSLFANQIASSYDGNMVLKGSASIAPVSNAATLAPLIPGTPNQGYLVMGLYGLQTVDSTFSAASVLAPPAKSKTSVLSSGCLMEILASYQNLSASQLLVGGALPDSVIAKLDHWVSPAQTTPTAPILLIQGTADESVPAFLTEMLVDQLHAYSQPVTYQEIDGATHDSAVVQSADTVATWLAGRY
ncbi:lipase family protein [Actinoplanes sp. KI2]|uniref:alpha/beta hydrolase family protein n=1 Tax=Actinoplanes sp. KI2 TaxID=2983315 RepID=UPI0021D606E1|nr:lipase family protein [Actinoplanes sp. KI2]MCU7728577.1 lipase family protein [Actinoplanes sp. KI2]